ncbi:gypsy type transposase, partial [Tanacetum coccineum]
MSSRMFTEMPTTSSMLSAYATLSTSMMLFRTMYDQLVPYQVRRYLLDVVKCYWKPKSSMLTLLIEKKDDYTPNDMFKAVKVYLSTRITSETKRLKLVLSSIDMHCVATSLISLILSLLVQKMLWAEDVDLGPLAQLSSLSLLSILTIDFRVHGHVKHLMLFVKSFIFQRRHTLFCSIGVIMHKRPAGKIGLYTRFLDFANFRLPLSTFHVDILRHFRINISQLSVIGAAKVSHFEILCRVYGIVPTVGLFRCFYVNSKKSGWISFSKRSDNAP